MFQDYFLASDGGGL